MTKWWIPHGPLPANKDIATICDVIHRVHGLVSRKTPDEGNKIFILIHVQDYRALFQGLQDQMCQQHICVALPALMGAGTENDTHCWGAQGQQKYLNKNYGEHSVSTQAHERYEGGLMAHVIWHHIKLALFTDMDSFIYLKQRKTT